MFTYRTVCNRLTIGSQFLFQVTMAMLTLGQSTLLASDDPAVLFNALTDLPSTMDNVDLLLKIRSLGFAFFKLSSISLQLLVFVHRRGS